MPETKDLLLNKARFKDWEEMLRNVWRHEESAQYMLWSLTTTEADAKARMERTLAYQEQNPCAWFVYEKESGQAIGFAGMIPVSEGVYEDCGICIGPAFVGQGYGKQILSALTEYAFSQCGAHTFLCACRSQNAPSRGMILGCGFQYTHSERRIDGRNGESYTLEFYELTK